MDVVNGKIVSARTERGSAEAWSGLRPSSARAVESIHVDSCGGRGGGRGGREWGAHGRGCVGGGVGGGGESTSAAAAAHAHARGAAGRGAAPCHGPATSLELEPGTARWSQRPSLNDTIAPRRALHEFTPQPQHVSAHRYGLGGDQRHYTFVPRLGPETNFDQMMTMYESLITRALCSHVTERCLPSSLGRDQTPTASLPSDAFPECSLQRSESDAASKQASEAQSCPKSTLVGTSSDLKRKRSDIESSEDSDQTACGWTHPLKLLVWKGLSVSDVGELGRIVIPKKNAESQFQQIDTKEGTLLEMEDYTRSKRWFFRFKWWINNKSRMYVLENTGEFIKYHKLKEHDVFIVYEDSSRKMVVRGHKGTELDSASETIVKSSSDKPSSKSEEDPASIPAPAWE